MAILNRLWQKLKSLATPLTSVCKKNDHSKVVLFHTVKAVNETLQVFTAALALRSRGLVIGSREKEREEEREEETVEEKNLQIAIRCL